MSRKKTKSRQQARQQTPPKASWRKELLSYLVAFAFGVVIAGCTAMLIATGSDGKSLRLENSADSSPGIAGSRTVAQLIALSDAELERVDIIEMNIAVAHGLPGLEKLGYGRYKKIVDDWTDEFARWMPAAEVSFHKSPQNWRNDINFFRLGLLATYLARECGIRYVEEYSQDQKLGKVPKYKDPGDLLLHGLIDTKRGTCANMPVLHVAIGRRLGWPVSLASVGPHYVCRYDDGKAHYNIEATYTGPGFVSDSDEEYMKNDRLPRRAKTSGSDFRSLSAREMLGVFISARARYYRDTNRFGKADCDYALARVLYPNHRYAYVESIRAFLWRGNQLFEPTETGHPADLAGYLASVYLRPRENRTAMSRSPIDPPMVYRNDSMAEINRINAINWANARLSQPVQSGQLPGVMMQPQPNMRPPGIQQPYQPSTPGQPARP